MESAANSTAKWCISVAFLVLILRDTASTKEHPSKYSRKSGASPSESVCSKSSCSDSEWGSTYSESQATSSEAELTCTEPKAQNRQLLKRHRRRKRNNLVLLHERPYWGINFDRNYRQSLIIRLPDELLTRIMEALKPADLYMVRQASFTFWRVYQGKEFEKFQRSEDTSWSGGLYNVENSSPTIVRAEQHVFCSECAARRLSPTYRREVHH
ncbi:hypothetical protein CNYM01_08303 [Colletotrichum nymphaeae SA-01]|uniref:F-box domain-containing protein n=1 Tax=Colletotrichum nymphaeae SA-01 TaxID=1460502 RepID=A0A135U465_9PEZI|nr:hypothetical protein CNYM01_08303 [Colletotrichum nymphaeae SA-01]